MSLNIYTPTQNLRESAKTPYPILSYIPNSIGLFHIMIFTPLDKCDIEVAGHSFLEHRFLWSCLGSSVDVLIVNTLWISKIALEIGYLQMMHMMIYP